MRNRHWLVVLVAFMVIVTFSFQPVTAALFEIRTIPWIDSGNSPPSRMLARGTQLC